MSKLNVLKDVLKALVDTPASDIQAVVSGLEAAAPKPVEREESGTVDSCNYKLAS